MLLKQTAFGNFGSLLIYYEIYVYKMKELIQEFKVKRYLLMIIIRLTGNFSNMKFRSSPSIILTILQKNTQKEGLILKEK